MRGWPRARSGSHGPGCTPGSTTWCTSKAKEYKVDALHLTFYMAFFSHWNIAYLKLRCRHDDSLFACFWTVCFLEQKRWEFIKKGRFLNLLFFLVDILISYFFLVAFV